MRKKINENVHQVSAHKNSSVSIPRQRIRSVEQQLRIAIESGQLYSFEWDIETDIVRCTVGYAGFLELDNVDMNHTKSEFIEWVLPEDKKNYQRAIRSLSPQNPTYKVAFRLVRQNKKIIWLEESGRACFDADGRLSKVVGMTLNASEARQSEHMLRELSRRLISSQEEERRSVARELHDHIGQELALLCMRIQNLDSGRSNDEHISHTDVHDLYRRIKEIAVDVSELSHRLHSSELALLGLSTAAEHLCRDFGDQYGIDMDYQARDIPDLDSEILLCFYRVLQEALQNVAKHSHATSLMVELRGKSNELTLKVVDDGVGFDLASVRSATGLGLISMRERMSLIGGRLEITSEEGHGTSLVASIAIPIGAK